MNQCSYIDYLMMKYVWRRKMCRICFQISLSWLLTRLIGDLELCRHQTTQPPLMSWLPVLKVHLASWWVKFPLNTVLLFWLDKGSGMIGFFFFFSFFLIAPCTFVILQSDAGDVFLRWDAFFWRLCSCVVLLCKEREDWTRRKGLSDC